jgi:hypothetical protein
MCTFLLKYWQPLSNETDRSYASVNTSLAWRFGRSKRAYQNTDSYISLCIQFSTFGRSVHSARNF